MALLLLGPHAVKVADPRGQFQVPLHLDRQVLGRFSAAVRLALGAGQRRHPGAGLPGVRGQQVVDAAADANEDLGRVAAADLDVDHLVDHDRARRLPPAAAAAAIAAVVGVVVALLVIQQLRVCQLAVPVLPPAERRGRLLF